MIMSLRFSSFLSLTNCHYSLFFALIWFDDRQASRIALPLPHIITSFLFFLLHCPLPTHLPTYRTIRLSIPHTHTHAYTHTHSHIHIIRIFLLVPTYTYTYTMEPHIAGKRKPSLIRYKLYTTPTYLAQCNYFCIGDSWHGKWIVFLCFIVSLSLSP